VCQRHSRQLTRYVNSGLASKASPLSGHQEFARTRSVGIYYHRPNGIMDSDVLPLTFTHRPYEVQRVPAFTCNRATWCLKSVTISPFHLGAGASTNKCNLVGTIWRGGLLQFPPRTRHDTVTTDVEARCVSNQPAADDNVEGMAGGTPAHSNCLPPMPGSGWRNKA
jgi:hypothetical protein